ncbi:MAG TPA: hypothetical protein VFF65_07630 [Phycisphaerales bacterium]|nr:hypothetical protein [Phycisphaerales bacterium]
MAVNRVDPAMVQKLVRDLLAAHLWNASTQSSVSSPPVLIKGQADPKPESENGPARWVRLVRVDVKHRPRHKGDGHTDSADVVVVLSVWAAVSALVTTSEAVNQTATAVAQLLDMAHTEDAATGHDVQMERAEVSEDADNDLQRAFATGSITVSGLAQRFKADGTGNVLRSAF